MIPLPVVTAWRKQANWPQDEQVEQDLIISKVLVDLFNHEDIKDKVAFRGGTALNKLIFPEPLRYSEDIDLNRTEKGPAGPLINAVKENLKKTFSQKPSVQSTEKSIKIVSKFDSIAGNTKKLKVEINVRETLPQEPLEYKDFDVDSDFFSGSTQLRVFNREEMIGTKLRALYQRSKGRDLFDLYKVNDLGIDWDKVVQSFKKLKIGATKEQYEKNMERKMGNKAFLEDIVPLLPTDVSYAPQEAYKWFTEEIIPRL